MTNLAPLARQRRAAALAGLLTRRAGNVIAVDFTRSRRNGLRPALTLDLGMRQSTPYSLQCTPSHTLAA